MTQVSVVIACYNAAGFVDRAIDSVRAQTLDDWEILAVDDCSSDDTREHLERLAETEPRIRVFSTPRNLGPSGARNLAIEEARGAWIAILDADDAFRPERLDVLTQAAAAENCDMAFDNLVYFDATAGMTTGVALSALGPDAREPVTLSRLIEAERPSSKIKYGFLKPIIRRAFLESHGLRYDTRVRLAEDFDLYARILLAGGAALLLGAPMYLYTTQVGHVSGVRSALTRTRYEPGVRLGILDRLIADHKATASVENLRLLERARRWHELYTNAHHLGRYRREGEWPAFFRLALSHPTALVRFLTRSRYLRRVFVRGQTASGV